MTVAINQKPQKESTLDKLMKGLAVAKSVTGVAVDYTNLQKYYDEKSAKENNIVSSKDLIEYGKDYNISDAQSPGSFSFGLQSPEGVKQVYLTPKDKKTSVMSQHDFLKLEVDGGVREVAPGTKGAKDVSYTGPDGKLVKTSILITPKTNPAKQEFDLRPPEAQEQIKHIAAAMANKADIKNEIDSALKQLQSPQLSEDQKVKTGQGLLKVLNSTQGKDAVGAEEAKRLGSFLEYKIGNFTQPGSFIGRDLNEFVDQVALTSARLGESYAKDESSIERLYGRGTPTTAQVNLPEFQGKSKKFNLIPEANAAGGQKISAEDLSALAEVKARLKKNPDDPVAKQASEILRAKGMKL